MTREYKINPRTMKSIDRRNATKRRMALGGIGSMEEAFQMELKANPDLVESIKRVKEEFKDEKE